VLVLIASACAESPLSRKYAEFDGTATWMDKQAWAVYKIKE